jgi:Domain of unknown function (DUF6867)
MGIIYEESSIWLFLLVTCILGGTAAWMSGRAVANGWQPLPQLIFYLLLLGVAVRFIHHALFGGTMFSVHYYVADMIVLMILGLLGFRYTRTSQMVTQYRWMYERTGPLTWRERQPSGAADLKTR